MSDCKKSKYIFFEKFFREFHENMCENYFSIYTMYDTLTNEMRSLFLGTLLSFETNEVLFSITKQKLLKVLKSILVDVSIGEPKRLKAFESYIDFHKYKTNLADTITSVFKSKKCVEDDQKSYNLMEAYRKWADMDLVRAKTKLELALIFIDQIGVKNDFYSFIEKFEDGIFLQYLKDIKNFTSEILKHREEERATY